MKARGFIAALGLGVLIGVIVFRYASATTPPAENAQWTPPQQRLPISQPGKTKNKEATKANAPTKQVQSNSSPSVQSNGARKDATSRSQVESHGSEHHQEKADLIATGVGVVLSAIRKPAPTPTPQPALVVIRAIPTEQKSAPHKRSHPKSSDDDVWSRINPVSK